MPSVDSNSSYSSSDSSTSPLSSPRALLADIMQHTAPAISSSSYFHHQHRPMKSNSTSSPAILPSHSCVTRYKTELCRPFTETGKCKYGDKCQFSHGMKELRVLSRHPKYKTEYCRTFHTTGYCPYGPRCHFIHDVHETRATSNSSSNANDFTMRRHSDLRTYSSAPKSTSRNRINSDYTTSTSSSSSSSQSKTTANATAFPFSFEELSEALLSYETDEIFSPQYPQAPQQVQQQQHRQEDFYPSRLSAMTDSLTYRAFSSSSSSNSSLAPQYI